MADSEKQQQLPIEQLPLSQEELQDDGQLAQGKPAPPPKEIIATKVTGTVKWFNVKSGYGFINRNDTKEDVFVHQSAIARNNPKKAVRSVGDGEVVEFDVVIGEKGNEAANVTGPSGEPVRGSQFAADKRRNFRPWMRKNRRKQGDGETDGSEVGTMVPNQQQPHDGQQLHAGPRQPRQNYRRGPGGGPGGPPGGPRWAPRGGGPPGGPRRYNNSYPRQPRRVLGGGDGSGADGGVHDQNLDGVQRGGDGGPPRRGGPQRRFFRRNYNNGPPPPRRDGGEYMQGQGPPPRQQQHPRPRRHNNRKPNGPGGAGGMDQQPQQNGGQEVQNTTTESTA